MTDGEIVEAFGGYQKMASAMGLKPNVVWHWRTRGIPFRYRYRVATTADALGVDVGGYDFLEARQ